MEIPRRVEEVGSGYNGALVGGKPAPVDDVTGASFYEQAPSDDAAVAHADELLKETRSK